MSKLLTAADILAADDLSREKVDVPEWGGHVFVQTLDGTGRDAFETDLVSSNGDDKKINRENFRGKLLGRCIVDDKGKRLFTEAQIEALGKKSAKALDRCLEVAKRLNALSNEDVEELTGNSEPGPSA